jgi:hypothetical protein
MILQNNFETNVLMPVWIYEQAEDKEHFKKLVLQYMRRYPDYTVKAIRNGFAVCERK